MSEEIDKLALRVEKKIAESEKILDECDFESHHRRIQENPMELFS